MMIVPPLRRLLGWCLAVLCSLLLLSPPALAFCGFYVAQADTTLFNQTSQVVIARDGDRTVLTMANDYQGEMKDFALVVPVPTVLKKGQVHVGDRKIIERLDAFSAPRLVEYFDQDPCQTYPESDLMFKNAGIPRTTAAMAPPPSRSLGVTIEEKFTVGEYDILVLSAQESDGLETWLRQNDYQLPKGASDLLRPYIRQNMKFFVAKVNLKEWDKTGNNYLRPLMMAYESPKFMLPIRLGMINAQGDQDLVVYLLSPKGRVELTNYRTVKITSDIDVPEFVEKEFSQFYPALFAQEYQRQGQKVGFLEYAWNMGSCDPCSADPLSNEELKQAGVFWLNQTGGSGRMMPIWQPPADVFITRLHLRYNRKNFSEDLQFQETKNQELFQGRYVIRHPFRAAQTQSCGNAKTYIRETIKRQEEEGKVLAKVTGWEWGDIRKKINFLSMEPTKNYPWWEDLWPKS